MNISEYLKHLIQQRKIKSDFDEFIALNGQGNAQDWKFDRDELHEKTRKKDDQLVTPTAEKL